MYGIERRYKIACPILMKNIGSYIINTSSTIIAAYTMSIKTLLKSHDARANLCSLKKKIGEPAGTNISTIITH